MNERIKELKEYAGKLAAEHCHDTVDKFGVKLVFHDVFAEKFTELIARECMSICGAIQGAGEYKNMPDFASGAARCRAIIKRDFGVEE